MNNQKNKLLNRDINQAISLAIKIKDQYDKSKKNPRDNSSHVSPDIIRSNNVIALIICP